MRKRALGRTGLQISELALGTWGLSGDAYGPMRESDQDRVIERAVTLGINLFDTADVYGRGDMEKRLGRILPATGTYVVTKLGTDLDESPPRKRFEPDYLRVAFERSRERLRREHVDVVLLHNPTMAAMGSGEGVAFMKELEDTGAVTAWGVSAGNGEVARAAVSKGARVVELAYNAFCHADLNAVTEVAVEARTGLLARSVLAHGILTGYWTGEREFYPGDHRIHRWTRDELRRRIRQLDALRPLVGGDVQSLRAAALRFVLSSQLVSSAVLGPRSIAQLDQLVREAGSGPPYLRDTQLAELAERLKALGVAIT